MEFRSREDATREVQRRSAMLLTELPPPYGGLSVHSERLRAMLERHGWQVEVAISPPRLPPGAGRFRAFVELGFYFARILRTPCTLVHDHFSTYSIGNRGLAVVALHVILLLSLRLRRVPWVVSCGNGFLPDLLDGLPPWLRALYRWLYAGASFAIAKNERILAAFESLGLGSRAQVIGTFLEPTRGLSGRPLSVELECYLVAHPVCAISAGFRFEPLYHLDQVVRAVAYVRKAAPQRGIAGNVGLIVLASHAEDPVGKSSFDVAVAETGLAGDVMVLRDIDNALDVVVRASVFVRATDVDGDANTVKEAMMLGVPVLATDLPGRPPGIDLIRRQELGSLGPRLLDTIVDRNPARIEANRKFIREDIANNTAAILAVYERMSGH